MDNFPAWTTAAFAVTVFFGAFGCIALLFRKKFAKNLLILSLLGVLVQFYYELFLTSLSDYYATFDWVMTIMIPIVCVFLIWVSKKAIAKDWIS